MSALFTTPALICLGIYTVLVAAFLWANYRLHRKPKTEPEVVNWLPLLPPVPPPVRETDADWLDLLPVEALSPYEVDVRFWQLADGIR